jgi:lipopolysaccharide transport system ATP-binding protein
MSRPIIEVSHLSKRYNLGAIGATSLREEVGRFWDRARGVPHPDAREFWALRDVSFTVQPGEVVGVIGRNGAGKSTLLKILSRITEPTGGYAKLRGRVASLLEVGTGFHPELSGRENIFLNGAILGMTRAEVRRKFDEIVAFAEVDQFIDTPVKRYSSGMYVRLAFAVAAHLEPEILIVDEVLAVGDFLFQQKCLGKMESVARQDGRTVLFVSHNLAAVQQLCHRAVLMRNGLVDLDAPTGAVVARYQSEYPSINEYRRPAGAPTRAAAIEHALLIKADGQPVEICSPKDPISLQLDVSVQPDGIPPGQVAVRVSTFDGTPVFTTASTDASRQMTPLAGGNHRFHIPFPAMFAPGNYAITVAICQPQRDVYDVVDGLLRFKVDAFGSLGADLQDDRRGVVEMVLPWTHSRPGT